MEDHLETTCVSLSLPNEILFKIMHDLDDESLLSCRLVNSDWCAASSFILQSRPTVLVSLSCCPASEGQRSLSSFIECLKESQKFGRIFPSVNFCIRGFEGKISKCPDIDQFFALTTQSKNSPDSGSALHIKSLRFDDIRACQTELNILEHLIFEKTPQLKTLALTFSYDQLTFKLSQSQANNSRPAFCDDFSTWTSTVPHQKLLSLQVLQLGAWSGAAEVNFCNIILQAAPNLQRFEGIGRCGFQGAPYRVYGPEHVQLLIDAKKLHLVKSCDFTIPPHLVHSGLLDREKLSGFQPKSLHLLNRFHSSYERPHLVRNLEQIKVGLREVLWTVKDSVEELHTGDSLGLLDKNSLPRFSKLRRLHLDASGGEPVFPPGIRDRPDVFPRLEKICFQPPELKSESTVFPDLSHIPVTSSVQSLEIKPFKMLTDTCLESMALMCPNVQSLRFPCFRPETQAGIKFNRIGPLIWRNMTRLKILILWDIPDWRIESTDHFEAAFTGFSLETVRDLKAVKPEDRPIVEEVEHLRVKPSILQMTELEKLVLNLVDESQVSAFPLSFKYAFDLMPGLTVDILVSN